MFVAQKLRKESIAEYLLYMWQIEDIIRACGLDIDKIESAIISRYSGVSEQQLKDTREWYESLIDMMRREGKEKEGHLQLNVNTLNDIEQLHRRLLRDQKFAAYAAEYYNTLPLIVELRAKSGDKQKGEIETCFEAMYGLLMLRLQHKDVSEDTLKATRQISRFLSRLAGYYKQDYNNELEFSE